MNFLAPGGPAFFSLLLNLLVSEMLCISSAFFVNIFGVVLLNGERGRPDPQDQVAGSCKALRSPGHFSRGER